MANEVKKVEKKDEIKDLGQKAITNMLNQVVSYAELENSQLTPEQKRYAVGIITNINKRVVSDKELSWGKLDIQGCQLPAQIKRFSRLELQLENSEIFIDIRNNGKTGLKDINIKLQYQGLEKIITKYCTFGGKKVIRFYKDVVCKGDTFEMKLDLATGLTKITKHEYYQTNDVDYRNKLENITNAYAIAYIFENNELIPYIVTIDKNRIERAKRSATTHNIWNADTRKMCIKTAVWELYYSLKPFIEMPQDILEDFSKATENDVDFNKDFVNTTMEEVKDQVDNNVDTEEIDNSFVEEEVNNTNTNVGNDNNNVDDDDEFLFTPFDAKLF